MTRFVDCDVNKTDDFLYKLQKTVDTDTYSLFESLRDMLYTWSSYIRQTDALFVYCLAEATVHEKLSDKKIIRIIKNYIDSVNDKGYARLYKYIPQELF